MTVETRLRAQFENERLSMPRGHLEEAMEHGNEIRRKRRLMAVALPAAAILALAVGVMALTRSGTPDDSSALLDQAADANAVLEITDTELEWTTDPAALGWLQGTATDGSTLYALSTAPGTSWEAFPDGNVPKAIYASSDGRTWTAYPLETPWVSGIGAHDGLLYAVGTAPGAAEGSVNIQVGVSQDDGALFETVSLPTDHPSGGWLSPRLTVTAEGVLVFGTWEGEGAGRRNFAFWSDGGSTFEEVDYPFANGHVDQSFEIGESAMVFEAGPAGNLIHVSDDAGTWRTSNVPAGLGWVVDAGEVGDEVVILGWDTNGMGISAHRGPSVDGPWERLDIEGLLPLAGDGMTWIGSADVSDGGVAVAIGANSEGGQANIVTEFMSRMFGGSQQVDAEMGQPVGMVLVSSDLATWTITPSSDLGGIPDTLMFTPSGELVASYFGSEGNLLRRWQAITTP
ncbi:hypothetical protein BH23ACT5_BH23ACT5_23040 [soil metagenome]